MLARHTRPGIAGRCNVCRKLVSEADYASGAHPCPYYHVDYSWPAVENPDNVEWVPGYRFAVEQGAKTTSRTWRMKPRVYRVSYLIDQDGLLVHTGGPKPTPRTQAAVEALFARERPGSNGGPPLDD